MKIQTDKIMKHGPDQIQQFLKRRLDIVILQIYCGHFDTSDVDKGKEKVGHVLKRKLKRISDGGYHSNKGFGNNHKEFQPGPCYKEHS